MTVAIGFHKRRDHPQRVGAAAAQALAMRLRIKGYSYEEIGRKIDPKDDTPARTAYRLVRDGLNAVRLETADEMRDIEVRRLDALLKLGFDAMEHSAKRKDTARVSQAMNTVIKLSERRAKLLGLDAPVKYDLLMQETRKMAEHLGISDNEFVNEMEKVAMAAWANSK